MSKDPENNPLVEPAPRPSPYRAGMGPVHPISAVRFSTQRPYTDTGVTGQNDEALEKQWEQALADPQPSSAAESSIPPLLSPSQADLPTPFGNPSQPSVTLFTPPPSHTPQGVPLIIDAQTSAGMRFEGPFVDRPQSDPLRTYAYQEVRPKTAQGSEVIVRHKRSALRVVPPLGCPLRVDYVQHGTATLSPLMRSQEPNQRDNAPKR